jgi:hypothetical protein
MNALLNKSIYIASLLLIICSLYSCGNDNSINNPPAGVNGRVWQVSNQQILEVWGTNYEMGYAHGYLMGDLIKQHIESVAKNNTDTYKKNVSFALQHFLFYPEYEEEINGIVDGMIAGGRGYIPALQRNVEVGDIKLWNDGPEQRFCTSFGVWDKTTDGKVIIARNLDLPLEWATYQIMIVREPGSGLKTVSWGMPGWVGIQAGINEYGITVTANSGGDFTPVDDYYPVIPVHRYILEHTTPDNYLTEPLNIVNAIDEYTDINIQIGAPDVGQENPVYYVEDGIINRIRFADEGQTDIIATNHMIALGVNLNDTNSRARYQIIEDGLNELYITGDELVSTEEAFSLLRSVEADIKYPSTIFCVVFHPDQMSFDVAVSDGKRPAPEMSPVTYNWNALFSNHEPVVSSMP